MLKAHRTKRSRAEKRLAYETRKIDTSPEANAAREAARVAIRRLIRCLGELEALNFLQEQVQALENYMGLKQPSHRPEGATDYDRSELRRLIALVDSIPREPPKGRTRDTGLVDWLLEKQRWKALYLSEAKRRRADPPGRDALRRAIKRERAAIERERRAHSIKDEGGIDAGGSDKN
jgi:hypothetical protein